MERPSTSISRKSYKRAWENLPSGLLTEKGKALVGKDPDLSDETIDALKQTEKKTIKKNSYTFLFDDGDIKSNIGFTMLSACINEFPDCCFAELVAIYTDLKKYPFLVTAIELNKIRNSKNGFKRFSYSPVFGLNVQFWKPAAYCHDALPLRLSSDSSKPQNRKLPTSKR